jgi:hypothetical protein
VLATDLKGVERMGSVPNDPGQVQTDDSAALRLGPGESVDGYEYQSLQIARQHFLDAVVKVEPGVLDDLQGDPLRLARQIWEPSARHGGDTNGAPLADLEMRLRDWQVRWHLGTEQVQWTRAAALWTLNGWVHQEVAGEPRLLALTRFPENDPALLPAVAKLFGLPAEFPLQVDPTLHFAMIAFRPAAWNPRLETRADATERIMGELRSHLSKIMNKIEDEQRVRVGDTPTPIKRSGRDHFIWLARYQVLGASFRQIADTEYREPQTVFEAIKDTATLIGLPLREPHRGGRPRKTAPNNARRA